MLLLPLERAPGAQLLHRPRRPEGREALGGLPGGAHAPTRGCPARAVRLEDHADDAALALPGAGCGARRHRHGGVRWGRGGWRRRIRRCQRRGGLRLLPRSRTRCGGGVPGAPGFDMLASGGFLLLGAHAFPGAQPLCRVHGSSDDERRRLRAAERALLSAVPDGGALRRVRWGAHHGARDGASGRVRGRRASACVSAFAFAWAHARARACVGASAFAWAHARARAYVGAFAFAWAHARSCACA